MGLVAGLFVYSLGLGACGHSEPSLEVQLRGRWTAVASFLDGGDTLGYGESSPLLVFGDGGGFEEFRDSEVVSRGALKFDCNRDGWEKQSTDRCVEFLPSPELLLLERYFDVRVGGDTLQLLSRMDDGFSHILVRTAAPP